ncbi:MAG: DUF366 family protein [Bdellovibrionaceae bacterium]|nr:DUF366 family protein [Pseudobdellovibrionaceae bacterium]
MKSLFIPMTFAYDGTQLRSLFAYLEHGLLGDSVVAWEGPCEISFEHMVDGEDLREQSAIRGSRMLHFIAEVFGVPLFGGVAAQRLLASLAADILRERIPEAAVRASVRRDGDDVYVENRKFSISIATVSPTSTLVHFAVNVSNQGTPVPTAALEEWGIAPRAFADELLGRFTREMITVREATMKVKWVR